MLSTVACNACGFEDWTVIFGPGVAQIHQIVRCGQCGLMYANPRRSEPESTAISRHVEDESDEEQRLHTMQRIEKERLQVRDYKTTRKKLNALFPRRGKLLEIGSGFGFLLAQFQADGWEVQGLDPNDFACSFAREQNHVEAVPGILETAGIGDGVYDVVIMNHVIEHLEDPLRTLRNINRVLRPNGYFVLETPRYDTLAFRILGRRERSLSCDGHVYFFTSQSLRCLCEAARFRFVDLQYVGRSLTLNRLAFNIGVMSKSRRLQQALDQATRLLHLNDISIYLNLRDMQRLCMQKL